MKDAKTFGVALLEDGAIFKNMPLLSMFALIGQEPLVIMFIFDCSGHVLGGDK